MEFFKNIVNNNLEDDNCINEITSAGIKAKTRRLKVTASQGGKREAKRKLSGHGTLKKVGRKVVRGGKLVRNTQSQSSFRAQQRKRSKNLRKSGVQAKLRKGRRIGATKFRGQKKLRAVQTARLRRKAGL